MAAKYEVIRWTSFEPPDIHQLRRVLSEEGYSVIQWSDGPGTSYETHRHSTHQSHWIISGVLELDVEGVGAVTLNPGDRDVMPADIAHSARVVGDEAVVYLIGEKQAGSPS